MLTPFVNLSSMTNSQTSKDNGEDIENTKEAMMVLNDKIEKDFEGNSLLKIAGNKERQSQVVSFFFFFQNKHYLKYKLALIRRK